MKKEIIEKVRQQQPLIHHLTNQVVMNFTANGLLAFGGSPIMAKEKREVKNIAHIADGVLINIGTIVEQDVEAMIFAGQKANERGIPVVLDPVGVAATPYRHNVVQQLLNAISFTAIKGNAGEIAHLVDVSIETKGVESSNVANNDVITFAKRAAQTYNTLIVVTGETDILADKHNTLLTNESGHPMLTKVTGAGCLLGSIMTACLTLKQYDSIELAHTALTSYGLAAERAMQHHQVAGSGTFVPHFLDELSCTNYGK